MLFDSQIWGDNHPQKGELGISPDEIYKVVLELGYQKKKELNVIT